MEQYFGYQICTPVSNGVEESTKNATIYWSKIWHSAIGLSQFIQENKELFYQKNVLELAAGLGLPSMVVSAYANTVLCTDYAADAIPFIQKTIAINGLQNVSTALLDWNFLPENLSFDTILLSDINYDTEQFEKLYLVLTSFLNEGKKIVLATPQRLMAKPFIEKILPFAKRNVEYKIVEKEQVAFINVLLLTSL